MPNKDKYTVEQLGEAAKANFPKEYGNMDNKAAGIALIKKNPTLADVATDYQPVKDNQTSKAEQYTLKQFGQAAKAQYPKMYGDMNDSTAGAELLKQNPELQQSLKKKEPTASALPTLFTGGIPSQGSSQDVTDASNIPLTNSPLNPNLPESENPAAQENTYTPVEQSIAGSVKVSKIEKGVSGLTKPISPIESLNGWMTHTNGDVVKNASISYPVIDKQQEASLRKQRATLAKGLPYNPDNRQQIDKIDNTLSLYSPQAKSIYEGTKKLAGNDQMSWFLTPQQQNETKQQLLAKYGVENENVIDNAIDFYKITNSRKAIYDTGKALAQQEGITDKEQEANYNMAANEIFSGKEGQAEEQYAKIQQQMTSPNPNKDEIDQAHGALNSLGYNAANWKDYTPGYRIVRKDETPTGYDNLTNNYINHYIQKPDSTLQKISKQNYVVLKTLEAKRQQLETAIKQINENKLNSMLPKEYAKPLKPIVVPNMTGSDYNAKVKGEATIIQPDDPNYKENVQRIEQQYHTLMKSGGMLEQAKASFEASARAMKVKQQGITQPNVDELLKDYEAERKQFKKKPIVSNAKESELPEAQVKASLPTKYWYNAAQSPNSDFGKLPENTQKFLMQIKNQRESDVVSGEVLNVPDIKKVAPESYIKSVEEYKKEAANKEKRKENKGKWFKEASLDKLAAASTYQNPETKMGKEPYMSGQLGAMTTPVMKETGKPSEKAQEKEAINKDADTIDKLSKYATLLDERIAEKGNPNLEQDVKKYKEAMTAYYHMLSKYEKETQGYKGKLKEFPYYVPTNDVHTLSKLTGLPVGFYATLNSSVIGKAVNAITFGNPDFRNYDPSGLTKTAEALAGLVVDAPLFWGVGELANGLTEAAIKGLSKIKLTEGVATSINDLSEATAKLVEGGMKPADAIAEAATQLPKDALRVKAAITALDASKQGMVLGGYNVANEVMRDVTGVRNATQGSKVKYNGTLYTIIESNGDKVRMIDESGNEKEVTRKEYDKYVKASYGNVFKEGAIGLVGGALMPEAKLLSESIMKAAGINNALVNSASRIATQAYAFAAAGSLLKDGELPSMKDYISSVIFFAGIEAGAKVGQLFKGKNPFAKYFQRGQKNLSNQELIQHIVEMEKAISKDPQFAKKVENAVRSYGAGENAKEVTKEVSTKSGHVVIADYKGKQAYVTNGVSVDKDGKATKDKEGVATVRTQDEKTSKLNPLEIADPKDLKVMSVQKAEDFQKDLTERILNYKAPVKETQNAIEPSSQQKGTTIPKEVKAPKTEIGVEESKTQTKTEENAIKKGNVPEGNQQEHKGAVQGQQEAPPEPQAEKTSGEDVAKVTEEEKPELPANVVKENKPATKEEPVKKGLSKEEEKKKKILERIDSKYGKKFEESGLKFKLYSSIEDAISKIKQKKGTLEQFKAMLLKNGAKQAELDWVGYDEAFKGKKSVTKEDIQKWIDKNKIELEEVIKGGEGIPNNWTIEETEPGLWEVIDENGNGVSEGNSKQAAIDNAQRDMEISDRIDEVTKFSKWKTPGGENYREFLLAIPSKRGTIDDYAQLIFRKNYKELTFNEQGVVNSQRSDTKKQDFQSPHFGEPNIVVHTRTQDFKTENGGKALNLEEVQSDWGQAGRKKGFIKKIKKENLLPAPDTDRTEKDKELFYLIDEFDDNGNHIQTYQIPKSKVGSYEEAEDYIIKNHKHGGIPDMPFKKTSQWAGLGLKRMVQEAAEKGYDAVTWATGNQQADRYDLGKQVKTIGWEKDKNGKYSIEIWGKDGEPIDDVVRKDMTIEEVRNIIGKDMANKIANEPDYKDKGMYEGKDLKVGGEGMKAFYDDILPELAEKLFKKKYGVTVEKSKIIGDDGKKHEVWGLKLTDKLKDAANQGFPMFKLGEKGEFTTKTKDEWYKDLKSQVDKIGDELGVKIRTFKTVDDLPERIRKEIKRQGVRGRISGIYDTKTGDIYIVSDRTRSADDVRKIALHEAVGHKGLRMALGKDFTKMLEDIYPNIPKDVHDQIEKTYTKVRRDGTLEKPDKYTIAEEYLAQIAEKDEKPTFVQNAISKVREMIRKMFGLKYSDNDIKRLFKLSREALKREEGVKGGKDRYRFMAEKPLSEKQRKGLEDMMPDLVKDLSKELEVKGKELKDAVLEYLKHKKIPIDDDVKAMVQDHVDKLEAGKEKEPAKEEAPKGIGEVAGIRKTAQQETAAKFGVDLPPSPAGSSTQDAIAEGRYRYNKMTDTEKEAYFKDLRERLNTKDKLKVMTKPEDLFIARARSVEMEGDMNALRHELDAAKGKEKTTIRTKLNDALAEWQRFQASYINPLKNKWSGEGQGMQGVEDIDDGTLAGIARFFTKVHNRSFSTSEAKHFSDIAYDINNLEKGAQERFKKWFLGKESETKKPIQQSLRDMADKLDKLKIHRPGVFAAATPASLAYDLGIEAVKSSLRGAAKGIDIAEAIGKAVNDGIDAIKKTDWYKKLSSKDAEEVKAQFILSVNKGLQDEGYKAKDKEELKKEVADKKKFTAKEARDVWQYAKENYINEHEGSTWAPQEYQEVLNKMSKELGMAPESLEEALTAKKTEVNITEERQQQLDTQRKFMSTARKMKTQRDLPDLRTAFAERKWSRFSYEERQRVWDYIKENYVDLGITDMSMIVKGLASDFGITTEQALDLLAKNKSGKKMPNEIWDMYARRRRVIQNAKDEISYMNMPILGKIAKKIPRLFFSIKVLGHFGVGGMTHAGMYVFTPEDWGKYIKAFGKQYRLAVDKKYYKKQMFILTAKKDYLDWLRAGLGINPNEIYTDYELFGKFLDRSKTGNFIKHMNDMGTRGFGMLKLLRYDVAHNLYEHASASAKNQFLSKSSGYSLSGNPKDKETLRSEVEGKTEFTPQEADNIIEYTHANYLEDLPKEIVSKKKYNATINAVAKDLNLKPDAVESIVTMPREDNMLRKEIALLVNHSTGASNIKFSKQHQMWNETISALAFAWRLEASRVARLTAEPGKGIWWVGSSDPAKRATSHILLRRIGEQIATYGSMLALNQAFLNWTGFKRKVNVFNPDSYDWLMFQIPGGHTMDVSGGMRSSLRFAIAMLSNFTGVIPRQIKAGKLVKRGDTMGSLLLNYLSGKESPMAQFIIRVSTGYSFNGQELYRESARSNKYQNTKSIWTLIMETSLPLPAEEAYNNYKEASQRSAEGVQRMMNGMKAQGMKPKDSKMLMGSIIYGVVTGLTGIRIGAGSRGETVLQRVLEKNMTGTAPEKEAALLKAHKKYEAAMGWGQGDVSKAKKGYEAGEFGVKDVKSIKKEAQPDVVQDIQKANFKSLIDTYFNPDVQKFMDANPSFKRYMMWNIAMKKHRLLQRGSWFKRSVKERETYKPYLEKWNKELESLSQQKK